MKYYELTYKVPDHLSEAEKNSLAERVVSCLPNPPVKREGKLSLISLEFYSEPEKISELAQKLKTETQIQKLMVLTKKIPTKKRLPRLTPARPRLAPRVEGAAPEGRASLGKAERAPKKVELKEIEKKLEEILGQ